MKVAYIRVSTVEQNEARQLEAMQIREFAASEHFCRDACGGCSAREVDGVDQALVEILFIGLSAGDNLLQQFQIRTVKGSAD